MNLSRFHTGGRTMSKRHFYGLLDVSLTDDDGLAAVWASAFD